MFMTDNAVLCNELWEYKDSSSGLRGTVFDGRSFSVLRETGTERWFCVVMIEDDVTLSSKREVVPQNFLDIGTELLNDWTAQQWASVDDPVLWSQAGFSPNEARELLVLPQDDKRRPSVDALEVLAGLRS